MFRFTVKVIVSPGGVMAGRLTCSVKVAGSDSQLFRVQATTQESCSDACASVTEQ